MRINIQQFKLRLSNIGLKEITDIIVTPRNYIVTTNKIKFTVSRNGIPKRLVDIENKHLYFNVTAYNTSLITYPKEYKIFKDKYTLKNFVDICNNQMEN